MKFTARSIMSRVTERATMQQPQPGPLLRPNAPSIQYVEDWFIYDLDVANLAAGATFNGNIQIQADSDFKLTKLTQFTDPNTGAAQTQSGLEVPLCNIQIVDTGSGRQLFSSPVAIGCVFGIGTLPFILPVPRIFKARSNIAISIANFSNATTYDITLSFIGSKIFQLG